MSEYWISQAKKFCDFCKCWITDNRPSVDFHEKGKRHQENVKRRIDEAREKGTAAAQKRDEDNDYMKQMERDALAAFKKDLENDPELAAQYKVKMPEVGPQLPKGYVPEVKPVKEEKKEEEERKPKPDEGEWYEAMSEMGYPYYWNTVTGEPIWTAPEKYVSLTDQGLAPPPPPAQTNQTQRQTNGASNMKPVSTVNEIPLPPGLGSIPLPGEESPPSPPSPSESESEEEENGKQDRHARGVYGTWARVQQEQEAEEVDYQLPQTQNNYVETIQVPEVPVEEVRVKFKEKRVTSLGTSNKPVAFKKRKLGDGARNVRRRGGDDD